LLSRCLSAVGIGFLGILSRRGFRPPYGRPTTPQSAARTRTGFPLFRTRETRLAQGALFTPGAVVSTATGVLPAARLPHRNGQPLSSRTTTRPGTYL